MRSSLSSPWLKVCEPQQKNLKGQHSSMVVRPLLSLKESCGHHIPASQSWLCVPVGKAASLVVNHHQGLTLIYSKCVFGRISDNHYLPFSPSSSLSQVHTY